MGIVDFFKNIANKYYTKYKEIGKYNSSFTTFGSDIYQSDLIRSCIRPLAEHTAKANAVCSDKRIEKLLNENPNMYMNGHDFLLKVRTRYEIYNTVFIYIQRDDKNNAIGFYPVPYQSYEAVEYQSDLYIKFTFAGDALRELVVSWKDLVVVRKDYNESDIGGDYNNPILETLELINTTNQGIANAIKSTSNLRGILKEKKAMLNPDDVKKQKDEFVKDYLTIENKGGIASIDSTKDFIPLKLEPTIANYPTIKEFRENVYRYFGVNDNIIMSDYTEEQMEAFYDSKIEPFLVALSLELQRKVFSEIQKTNAFIVYEANRMQFTSMKTKISIYKEIVLYGGMTRNEWRAGSNLAPIEGGDEIIMRLDAQIMSQNKEEGEKNGGEG